MNLDDIIESHKQRLFDKLNKSRENSRFTDFTIYAGDGEREIRVHKVVMAACSDYFNAMWSGNFHLEEHSVTLPDNPDAVQAIVDFCYTNKLELDEDNIDHVLSTASFLLIQPVLDICVRYLDKNIRSNTCLIIALKSERYEVPDELRLKAYSYCMKNFEAVMQEQEFLDLDYEMLSRVVSDDQLESEETIIMNAVIRWCEYDREVRAAHLYDLIKGLRLVFMDPAHLIDFSTRDLIQGSPQCKDLFAKAKDYLLLQAQPTRQKQLSEELNTRFRTGAKRYHIYALGGWQDQGKALDSAEVYHAESDTWQMIPSMSQKRCGVGATTLTGSIYAVGGHDGSSYLRTVERFDTVALQWSNVAALQYPRTSLAVATVKNRIYAIGGQRPQATDRVEMFDPNANVWQDCAPMRHARFGAGVAVSGDFIYVIGGCGFDIISDMAIILNSVERYDTINDCWMELQPMKYARKHLGCCTCAGNIYAVGGRDSNDDVMAKVERYDPDLNIWKEISPMNQERAALGVVEIHGNVYAAGGQCSDKDLDVVEAYDPRSDVWSRKSSMKLKRLGLGTTVHTMSKYQN